MKKLILLFLSSALFVTAFAVDQTPTKPVMLRRLELRTITLKVSDKSIPIRYADLLREVLLSPSPNGSSTDELVKTVAVWLPIKADIAAGKQEILLDAEAYALVCRKLDAFRWGTLPEAAEAAAEFIGYVRGLMETEFTASPKPSS